MNFRFSMVLILILVLVGGYVGLYELRKAPPREDEPPWIYNVNMQDITRIAVTHQGATQAFVHQEDGWHFADEPDIKVDRNRWGGIVLILMGPQSQRLLSDTIDDPGKYGLVEPSTEVYLELLERRTVEIDLGDKTPDGESYYAKIKGYPQLFLIHSSWGQVLNRLVTEPPYPQESPDGS